MKKFIIKTLLISLPLLILAVPTEYLLRQIPNDYSYKKDYLDTHANEIKILVLGSSHAYRGINPEYFSKSTFNASHVSQSLDFDLAILEKYQNSLNSLKIIILPLSYFSLFSKLESGTESWRVKNYAVYYGITRNHFDVNLELLSNRLIYNLLRLYDVYIQNKSDITCTELGFSPRKTYISENAAALQETGKTVAKRHTIDDMFSPENAYIFDENLKILNSFSKFCSQRKIKLILLTTPTYYTYRENLNPAQLNKTVETIDAFMKEHPYWYYLNWLDDSDFVANDFYDADHLNETGARKLSKKLSQQIDSLGILK